MEKIATENSLLRPGRNIFRTEVLERNNGLVSGQISLNQPIADWIVIGFSLLVTVSVIAFSVTGSINRKARVIGITMPAKGALTISTPIAGVLLKRFVNEGATVAAGDPLFEISAVRNSEHGEVTALIEQQLAARRIALQSEKNSRITQDAEKLRVIEARFINIDAELAQLQEEVNLTLRRQGLGKKSLQQYLELERSGFVSSAQTQQKQEELIDLEVKLSALQRAKVQLQASRLSLQSEKSELVGGHASALSQLERAEASLAQEFVENQNRKSTVIVAPRAGVVTTITNLEGQAVTSNQIIATLVATAEKAEKKASLEVHLFAPSRTAGFVASGQKVLIRYESYPYQKFGLYPGVVMDVSETPLSPSELPANISNTILSSTQQNTIANSRESLYRIRVNLVTQYVDAYGKKVSLKPGMTLEADIVQENRKIWEWMFEPILARMQY